jgi:hypothetical protein
VLTKLWLVSLRSVGEYMELVLEAACAGDLSLIKNVT